MAKERLSKLQKWILRTAFERGHISAGDDIGKYILRRELVAHWLYENCESYRWGNYGDWKEEAVKILPKFNAALTRSIKNLHDKGLVRTFSISRPDLVIWALGSGIRQAKLSRGLMRLQGADTTEEDKMIDFYESAKKARKEGRWDLREIKADDRGQSTQAISFTDKGEQLTLLLTLPKTRKFNNKEK